MDAYNTPIEETELIMSKDKEEAKYSVGDLVVFNGRLFTPDYTYVDQYNESYATVGMVVRVYAYGNYIDSCTYRVYWFKARRCTQVIGGHLRMPTRDDLDQ